MMSNDWDDYETVPMPSLPQTSPIRRIALFADVVRCQTEALPTEIQEASHALFMAVMAFYCEHTEISMPADLRSTLDAMSVHPSADRRNTLVIAVHLIGRSPAALDGDVGEALVWARRALAHTPRPQEAM